MVCRPLNPWLLPLRWIVTIYFGVWRLVSHVRVSHLGLQELSVEMIWPNAGQDKIWLPPTGARDFSWDAVDELKWEEQFARPLNVRLSARTNQLGNDALKNIGVPEGAWFACVHVREGGFWGDHTSPRNANIHFYVPMLKEIVSAGGHVVRMGDATMTPLPDLRNVHDYAVGPFKSSATDAYLIRHCRFFIGMQSGLQDAALLYERPCLIVNMYDPDFALPFPVNHRGMFKIFQNSVTGDLVDPLDLVCHLNAKESRSVVRENSSDELTMAIRRFLNSLNKGFPEHGDHARESEFRARYRAAVEDRLIGTPISKHDLVQSYRYASRLTSGTVSRILTPFV